MGNLKMINVALKTIFIQAFMAKEVLFSHMIPTHTNSEICHLN